MNKLCVKVPGKVMLAGEYSVLWGGLSLAFTLDRYLTVRAETTTSAGVLELHSQLWPQARTVSVDSAMTADASLYERAARSAAYRYNLTSLRILVDNEFSVRAGFGSSSALVLGIMLAAASLQDGIPSRLEIAQAAWQVQRAHQGFASGYDIATQCTGGLVLFRQTASCWPAQLETLPVAAEHLARCLRLYTCDRGAPTISLGACTADLLRKRWGREEVIALSNRLVSAFAAWLGAESRDRWNELFAATTAQRQLLLDTPAYSPLLSSALLAGLPGFDQRWSAKSTGAGGDDALLVYGYDAADLAAAHRLLLSQGWQQQGVSLSTYPARIFVEEEKWPAL